MIIARRDRTLASYPRTTDIGGHTSWRHKHQMGSTPLRMVMGFVGRGSAVVALALRRRRRLAHDEAILSSAPKPTARVIAHRVRAPRPTGRPRRTWCYLFELLYEPGSDEIWINDACPAKTAY